ncbi:DUF4124 domain-containing protein [Lysobacter solisilvae (ex Woo and Kim 2020)]|uniref:DUF4124 domain-containing protein n=1 Tax=Agrilutibacter terrestris TaxID=2865112 RepID=A0A7H0FZD8_9GAMM|nr:DUF4124 domain-containing protein [Lysobacter terrestris]QNP41404.1 DUF4124 domain-containing protein [Lysobacter terrestris]
MPRTSPRRTIRLFLALAVLLAALPVFAAKVYQWKDANGVTHYSDAPPPSQQGVRNRDLKDARAASAAAEPTATAPADPVRLTPGQDNPNCATYRSNLAQLQSSRPVGEDANGDGKPDSEMNAGERAQQIEKTQRLLQAYCTKPAGT